MPFDLIGDKADIRLTKDTVEVFFHGNRVASHARRQSAQRNAITIPEHMPEAHRRYLSYNKDEFLAWGTQIGSATHQTVESFLTSGKEPEQGFKYCTGLTKAADRYGKERLEAACARVLVFSTEPTLRSILTVLKNGQDKIPLGSNTARKENGAAHHRSHGITRGAEAFRKGGENA